MSVSIFPPKTDSASPLQPSFTYNFPTEQSGYFVDLDLQAQVPAGSYNISGFANFDQAPRRIQLLASSGNIVGTASTTWTRGAVQGNNTSTYSASITANSQFTKIRFLGDNLGSNVLFSSSAPTNGSHVRIDVGSRIVQGDSLLHLFFKNQNTVTWTASLPGSAPSGYNYLTHWYFNNRIYYLVCSVPPGNAAGVTNNITVFPWNLNTKQWETNSNIVTPTAFGRNSTSSFPSANSVRAYPFANGNVFLRILSTFDSGTTQSNLASWFSYSTSQNLLVQNTNSLTYTTSFSHFNGQAYYLPNQDQWISFSAGDTIGDVTRVTNSFSTTNIILDNRSSTQFFAIQDSANPSFISLNKTGNSTDWTAYGFNGFSSGNSQAQALTADNSVQNSRVFNPMPWGTTTATVTQINGVVTHLHIGTSTSPQIFIGRPTFADLASTDVSTKLKPSLWRNGGFIGSSDYLLANQRGVSIQPFSSNTYGIVFGPLSGSSHAFSSLNNFSITPLPSTLPLEF